MILGSMIIYYSIDRSIVSRKGPAVGREPPMSAGDNIKIIIRIRIIIIDYHPGWAGFGTGTSDER